MSSIRKRGEKWQARVHRKEHKPVVQSFNTKADAIKWARNVESQLDLGILAPKQTMPRMMSLLARYLEEVTPTKKGVKQERNRIKQLQKSKLADMQLDKITSEVISQYRDTRLKTVSANTVRIELALISVLFEQCRKEWGFALANPVRGIRIPKPGKPRQRRLEAGEEEALLAACRTSRAYYLHSFVLLAIETGMRCSELLALRWEHVNLSNRTAFLPDTKNGHPRTVPLSTRAVGAIQALPRAISGKLFNSGYQSIHNAFKLAVTKAQGTEAGNATFLKELRLHDLRHEAVTRLFEKGLNPIEVAMVSGHKTLSMLQRYTHLRSEELVAKLA